MGGGSLSPGGREMASISPERLIPLPRPLPLPRLIAIAVGLALTITMCSAPAYTAPFLRRLRGSPHFEYKMALGKNTDAERGGSALATDMLTNMDMDTDMETQDFSEEHRDVVTY